MTSTTEMIVHFFLLDFFPMPHAILLVKQVRFVIFISSSTEAVNKKSNSPTCAFYGQDKYYYVVFHTLLILSQASLVLT